MYKLCQQLSKDDDYLDFQILSDYHDVIYSNDSTLFLGNSENMHYAIFMRMLTVLKYLNSHQSAPQSSEEMILFISYSSMIVDAIELLFKNLNIKVDFKNPYYHIYFEDIWKNEPFNFDSNFPCDDKFFEYFRSIVMAHPFETNRIFKQKKINSIHYSPNAIVSTKLMKISKPGIIGVKIYSNNSEKIHYLLVEYQTLKKYIKSRYEMFNIVIEALSKK